MTSDLEKKIIKQIEYYFGDINLPRDKFLQEKIKEDDGWITLDVLLSFKRLAGITTDQKVIADAVEKSEDKIVEVSEDRKKLRRNPEKPLPELNEDRKKELVTKTAYAKGFPADETLDAIVTFLEPYGPIESCQRRTYVNREKKEHVFKGSCFIIFKTVEDCKKFIEAESIKYKDVELIRKWQEKYFEEKKLEMDQKRNKGKKKKENEEVEEKEVKITKGAVMQFSGISPEKVISWEAIKSKVEELSKFEVSYIDYKRGGVDGYVRFSAENNAVDFVKTLEDGKLKVEDDVELTCKSLEVEEEEEYMKKVIAAMKDRKNQQRNKRNFGGKFNRKRKGKFMNEGPKAKK